METAALNPWRERLTALLIPPGARESVMGDLRESCAGEAEILGEVLRAAPYVIFSQMQRNLNGPALLLQLGLAWWCFGAIGAAGIAPLLLLRETYQPLSRPSARRALRDAVLMSFCGVLLFFLLPLCWPNASHGHFIGVACFLLGAPLSLCLCLVRTGLILDGDRRGKWLGSRLSMAEMRLMWRDHRRGVIRRNRLEAVLLALAAVWLPALTVNAQAQEMLAAMFAAAALWLVLDAPRRAAGLDFVSLRATYSQSLLHQQQLRGFLWWLWLSPLLLTFRAVLPNEGEPSQILENSMLAVLLCFLVTVLNREGGGRAQEEIVALSRLRETAA
ncbi:MAG TPA: hypothetical protein VHZ32_04415 [Rhizomicrobium sp.]|nr:hypothetical protein [Rhizomicrobium sp.]